MTLTLLANPTQIGMIPTGSLSATDKAALQQLQKGAVSSRRRPGEAPGLFTSQLAGFAPACLPLASSGVASGLSGLAYRVTGAAIIAPRETIWVDPSRTLSLRFQFRRFANPTDPNNDVIRSGVQWLDASGSAIGAPLALSDKSFVGVASGLQTVTVTLPSNPSVLPPSGAVYARPFIQTFGGDGVTDVLAIAWVDVTDASAYSPDLSATNARVTALETEVAALDPLAAAAANGYATLDQFALPAQIRPENLGITRAQIATSHFPASLARFRTLDDAPWVRGVDGSGPMAIQDAGGQWWKIDISSRFVKAIWFGVDPSGIADSTAALQAAIDALCPNDSSGVTTRGQAMAGGGTVELPQGWIRVTNTIYRGAYLHLKGAGSVLFPQQNYSNDYHTAYQPGASPPNGTIIVADFPSTITAFAPVIHTSPFVLTAMANQTVGTRYKASAASGGDNYVPGTAIDNSQISYCEGADDSDYTIFAVNPTHVGLRLTASPVSTLNQVTVVNCANGVIGESNWESKLVGLRVSEFTSYGYNGNSNQHALVGNNWWIHSGSNTVGNIGVYLNFAEGASLDGIAIDNVAVALWLQSAFGVIVNGLHSEYTRDTLVKGEGCQNCTINGMNYSPPLPNLQGTDHTNTVMFDGGGCDIVINIAMDHPNYGANTTGTVATGSPTITNVANLTGFYKGTLISGPGIPPGAAILSTTISGAGPNGTITMNVNATAPGTGVALAGLGQNYAGKTFPDVPTNPFTGQLYDFAFDSLKNITVMGRSPQPGEESMEVIHSAGLIKFVDLAGSVHYVSDSSGHVAIGTNTTTATGMTTDSTLFAGVRARHRVRTATSDILYNSADGVPISGHELVAGVRGVVLPGGGHLFNAFGTPETFITGNLGDLCTDTANGALYIKVTGVNTTTGWKKVTTA